MLCIQLQYLLIDCASFRGIERHTSSCRDIQESLPISSFSPKKLSPQGVCLSASTDEGVVRRNTMHFRVKADAFVPAGGRPNTINAGNEHVNIQFLPFDTNGCSFHE